MITEVKKNHGDHHSNEQFFVQTLPTVDKDTLPKCRRFTYEGFSSVWHIIPTESVNIQPQFTLRERTNKNEHAKSFVDLNGVFIAWINRSKDKKKAINKIINAYNTISETLTQYTSNKKWIFGSNSGETRKNKKIYAQTYQSLFTLCKSELIAITKSKESTDPECKPRNDRIDSITSTSLPQTPASSNSIPT